MNPTAKTSVKENLLLIKESLANALAGVKAIASILRTEFVRMLTRVAIIVWKFINGRFGKNRLKKPYRIIWKFITWGTIVYFFSVKIMFPFMEWCEGVVNLMNYVIWG